MFAPTEFPCTAWYVTPSLSLREVTLISLGYTHRPECFFRTNSGYKYSEELFATRADAIAGATVKLADQAKRLREAGYRHEKRRQMVEKLQAEISQKNPTKK